jgi:transposase-like protein
MQCSIPCRFIPILPRELAVLLLLSLLLQTSGWVTTFSRPSLPVLASPAQRGHPVRQRRRTRRLWDRFSAGSFVVHGGLRLLVRWALLVALLHTSGWLTVTAWSACVLLLPLAQLLLALGTFGQAASLSALGVRRASAPLQRLYQLTLVLLLVSSLLQFVSRMHPAPGGLFIPFGLTTWVTHPDDDTEVRITATKANRYTVTLRGAFQLVWEPRDSFERWLLILFLRKLHLIGERHPLLTQRQIGHAFGMRQCAVSLWETQVRQHGWHVLSDRFRHALHTFLPDAERSHAILQVWVPAFWLSAWEVRERLIQLGVLPDREALAVEALHALAQHVGFSQVRNLLLERFDLQGGQLFAKAEWWLPKLLALNERLIHHLERGERLTPQELVEVEPLRLKPPEKPAASEPPPLAAALKSALFDLPPETLAPAEPVRCTYCGSDQVAPKSKRLRLKTIIDEFGEKHVVEVLRFYCHNLACPYQSFTHLPAGVLPHSPYPIQVRLLAVEVYVQLLSTYRRSARLFTVKASTVYHWVAAVSPAALCLAAYFGVVRTSGVVGIDDKWILVCSPSAIRPHGHHPRAVWRYVYVAVDAYSLDLLAMELYPEHSDQSVRLFLLELKAKGIRPRVVVSDLDPAYGRMLPHVFPDAVHHECIFHAIQNALNQMTRVYGRYYLEKIPETAPLHEAITHLFHAQTQKTVRHRLAELMELRSAYVTRTPEVACVFDSLDRHWPKLINAIESPYIPRTNNATELVIRRFDQHYQSMCGLDSFESAQVYLRLFELVYRLTPFADDGRPGIRGKCPLELAGYDLKALPIADFFINLKLPSLTIPAQPLSP